MGRDEKNLRKKPAKVGGGTKKIMEGGTKKTLKTRLPTAPLGVEMRGATLRAFEYDAGPLGIPARL